MRAHAQDTHHVPVSPRRQPSGGARSLLRALPVARIQILPQRRVRFTDDGDARLAVRSKCPGCASVPLTAAASPGCVFRSSSRTAASTSCAPTTSRQATLYAQSCANKRSIKTAPSHPPPPSTGVSVVPGSAKPGTAHPALSHARRLALAAMRDENEHVWTRGRAQRYAAVV